MHPRILIPLAALLLALPFLGSCDPDKSQGDDDDSSASGDDDTASGDDDTTSGDDDDSSVSGDDDDSSGSGGPFTLRTETSNFTRNQGGSGAQHVYVDRKLNFTEAVTLEVTNVPTGVTVTYEPVSVEKDVGVIHLDLDSTAATGDHDLEVVGTSTSSETDTVTIPLTVNSASTDDFAIDVYPLSEEISLGDFAVFEVELQWHGTFTDDADLECQGLPAGITCTFDADPVTNGALSTDMTVTVAATASPGEYPIIVNAVAGLQAKTSAILVGVGGGGSGSESFALESQVTNYSINQDMDGSMTVWINRSGGHSDSVALGSTAAPTGVTVSFEEDPAIGDSAVMIVEVGATAATGDGTITVEGNDGGMTSTADFPITVNATGFSDYALDVDDYSQDLSGGTSGSVTVEVQRDNFTSDVALTCDAPTEVVCTITTSTVTSSDTGSAVTLEVDGAATAGVYPIAIQGVGDSISKLVSFQVVVP